MRNWAQAAAILLVACGCAGPRLIDRGDRAEPAGLVARASDEMLEASIENVLVPNAAGAWASDAHWDEYVLRVRGAAAETIVVMAVELVDALGTRVTAQAGRTALAVATQDNEKRYTRAAKAQPADSASAGGLIGGTAVAASAAFYASGTALGSAYGTMMGGSAAAGSGTAATMGPLFMIGGAAIVTGTIVQMRNNADVDRELRRRATTIPIFLSKGAEARATLFYPLTPLARALVVRYSAASGERELAIDIAAAMAAAHRPRP